MALLLSEPKIANNLLEMEIWRWLAATRFSHESVPLCITTRPRARRYIPWKPARTASSQACVPETIILGDDFETEWSKSVEFAFSHLTRLALYIYDHAEAP